MYAFAFYASQLLWSMMSDESAGYEALYAVSMAMYTLPRLLESAAGKVNECLEIFPSIRTSMKTLAGEEQYLGIGIWFEGSRLGDCRKSFHSSDIGPRGFLYKEWDQESFSCTVILLAWGSPLIIWGSSLARLLCWLPFVLEVSYYADWKDSKKNSLEVKGLRRRDIFALCKYCKAYRVKPLARPLLRGRVAMPRSVSLQDTERYDLESRGDLSELGNVSEVREVRDVDLAVPWGAWNDEDDAGGSVMDDGWRSGWIDYTDQGVVASSSGSSLASI
jgi:hypothetical protein